MSDTENLVKVAVHSDILPFLFFCCWIIVIQNVFDMRCTWLVCLPSACISFPQNNFRDKKKVDVSPQGETRRRWTNCKVALTDIRANHGRGRGLIQNLFSKIYCVLRTISEPKIDNLVAIEDRLQNRWSKSWNELQESKSQRIVRTTSSDFFHQFIYFSESKVCL